MLIVVATFAALAASRARPATAADQVPALDVTDVVVSEGDAATRRRGDDRRGVQRAPSRSEAVGPMVNLYRDPDQGCGWVDDTGRLVPVDEQGTPIG
ncbi:MAG: hypothetical protein HYX34_02225 [Actinobacteria bacterium]|nr:hypothetical protein [Actinomycetota bacterium]